VREGRERKGGREAERERERERQTEKINVVVDKNRQKVLLGGIEERVMGRKIN